MFADVCCSSSAKQLDATVRGLTLAALSGYKLPQLQKALKCLEWPECVA